MAQSHDLRMPYEDRVRGHLPAAGLLHALLENVMALAK
ncbi:hypothetical protein M2271_007645 [Streptomyces sp. LBL]|nr:hypothetical protein [Streptomyces sp. LBL]